MTVSTSTSFVSYAGNGSLTTFAYTFKIFQDSDLLVTLVNDTTGVETTQVLTTDYTVSGAGSAGGGNVTFTTAPASGTTVKIRRVLPVTQETDYVANDPFPAEAHEDALDKLTMLVQQEAANSDLAIQFPEGDVGSGLNNIVPSAVDRADKILKFDTEGNVEVAGANDVFSGAILGASYTNNTFTGNGSTTAFTLTVAPGSKLNCHVYIDGVYQNKATYSVNGVSLTFTEAPPLNAAIECIIGQAISDFSSTADLVTYDQGGTGASARSVESKLQDTVSVKDFGAVGDGVTDDTAAIQAAIDYLSGIGGGELFFPKGEYAISNKIIIAGGIHYIGTAGGASKIVKHSNFNTNNPTGDVMWVSKGWDTATGYNGAANGVITDMSFDEGNHTLTYGDAIALGHAANWVVERCRFFGMRFHGVDVTGSENITIRDCYYFGTVGQSINAFQADQATSNAIKGINADSTGSDNIKFLNNYVTGASWTNSGVAEQSAAFHIHRSNNTNILIDGNYVINSGFLCQTDSGSTGNAGIFITNNVSLRGTVDTGSSPKFILLRGEADDVIISDNRTYNYNVDIDIAHPTTSGFSTSITIADNVFNFANTSGIVVSQAYRVTVANNIIRGVSGDYTDVAVRMAGVNYFNIHNNQIYDPDGDGIEVTADAGGGNSSGGLIHDNYILNGDTGLVCAASASDTLFYSNRLTGAFSTAQKNINQNLANTRDLDFPMQERTVTLAEAGRTINAGATAQINITITGAIQGDIVLVGYDKDTQGLQIYGNMYGFQAGRIYLYNPTGSNITLAAGNWKVIAKSSRFIS